jgi:hypothetical protein
MKNREQANGLLGVIYSKKITEELTVFDVERNLYDSKITTVKSFLGLKFTNIFNKVLTFEIKDIPKTDGSAVLGFTSKK